MTTKKQLINIIQIGNDLPTNKKIETNQQTELKESIQKPQVSPFDTFENNRIQDTKDNYEQQPIEIKQLYPKTRQNELKSHLSKKKTKKNFKYFDQLAQQIKQEYNNKDSDLILNKDDNLQILQKNKEPDQIIQYLRSNSFKLIFCNSVLELKGQTILDAINQNQLIIFINQQQIQKNVHKEDQTQETQQDNEQQEEAQQIREDDDNLQIVNNIKDYL